MSPSRSQKQLAVPHSMGIYTSDFMRQSNHFPEYPPLCKRGVRGDFYGVSIAVTAEIPPSPPFAKGGAVGGSVKA